MLFLNSSLDCIVTHQFHNCFKIDLKDQKIHYVFDGFLDILLSLLAHRDYYTYLHSLRVAELSRRIGIQLHLRMDEVLALEHGGLIHDIGKLSIPDDVLLKPGRFSIHDRHIMNSHALIGADLFKDKGIDTRLIDMVLQHHERLDGSGYPQGREADSISFYARIIAVADVYEALIARRPYKRNRSHEDALEILLLDVQNRKLDKNVVEALTAVTERWNPLTIEGNSYPESLAQLEDFRHSCYFREPLSQFYSYRYLFSFENDYQSPLNATPYALFALCFRNLKTLNRQKGYLETDNVLCTIGEQLQDRISEIVQANMPPENPVLLFLKKGADYIIYNQFDPQRCQRLEKIIRESISEARSIWGVECECRQRRFGAGEPFKAALDVLFT